jgi:proteasome accessory factor B
LIDTLQLAVEESKAVHLLYQSERATESAYRDVHPYGVIYHRGALYLVALDPEEDKVKLYKVDRIEGVEISLIRFRRPTDFDLARFLSTSFGVYQSGAELITVKVSFAPAAARYVQETKWHSCHRLTKQRDGSVLAEFRLSCTTEIKSWVLGFGAKARVLEPESLRREIAEELGALLSAYSSPDVALAPAVVMNAGPLSPSGRSSLLDSSDR